MRTTTQPPPPSSGQPSRRQLGGRETSPKSTDPPSRSSFHQQPTSPSRYSCRRGGERQRQEIRTSDTYSLCLLATRRPPLPRPSRVPVSASNCGPRVLDGQEKRGRVAFYTYCKRGCSAHLPLRETGAQGTVGVKGLRPDVTQPARPVWFSTQVPAPRDLLPRPHHPCALPPALWDQ